VIKHLGSLFWILVLGGSLLAVVAGFAGGRSFGNAAIVQLHPAPVRVPAPPVARPFERDLRGLHSLDEAAHSRDPYDEADAAVAERPAGWASEPFDGWRSRARVALVVVDAGRAGTPASAFVASPIPFTLVVPARGAGLAGFTRLASEARKVVLVDASGAGTAQIRARIAGGAIGTLSDATAGKAGGVVSATGPHGLVLDALLAGGGASYRAARLAGLVAIPRDVIVDGRDAGPLVATLFDVALARAERTGVAVVLLHARPDSLAAAERFAVRAQRDGVDVVPLDQLVARD
jgi:hypothetical protein